MSRDLDEVLNELSKVTEDLESASIELERATSTINQLMGIITDLCERLAIVAFPNYFNYDKKKQRQIVEDLMFDYIRMPRRERGKHEAAN